MKNKRLAKILELILSKPVNTQEEILKQLQAFGFRVTQATVSRDMKELGIIKVADPKHGYRYIQQPAGGQAMPARFYALFSDSVIRVEYALNNVVIKCHAGMAQAVCVGIDAMHWDGLIGTLSGDDTVLLITRDETGAQKITKQLLEYID